MYWGKTSVKQIPENPLIPQYLTSERGIWEGEKNIENRYKQTYMVNLQRFN